MRRINESHVDLPAALIRRMDGRIAFWSPAMEERYGFAACEAIGRVSHQLLRTTSWQALDEIETVLVDRNEWSGGLIHRRVDGRPVMAANRWYFLAETGVRQALVTELHSDIVPVGSVAGAQFADVMATVAHELSQPLTAIGSYISGTQRTFKTGWPDQIRSGQAMTQAIAQVTRTRETLRIIRSLGDDLREKQEELARSYATLKATFAQTKQILDSTGRLVSRSRTVRAEIVAAREQRQPDTRNYGVVQTPGGSLVVQNVEVFQSLLRRVGRAKLDAQSHQMVKLLLAVEEAKLRAESRHAQLHELSVPRTLAFGPTDEPA
jgi:signal transduction histidine kinase